MGRLYHIFFITIVFACVLVSPSLFAAGPVIYTTPPNPSYTNLCSVSSRGTSTQTIESLYNLSDLQKAYIKKVSPSVNLTDTIAGATSRHHNKQSIASNGKCDGQYDIGTREVDEIAQWPIFWSKNTPSYNALFGSNPSYTNQIGLIQAANLQSYIYYTCGFDLKEDGKVGIKTLNAPFVCTPPCNGKCGRNTFDTLKDKLFYDKEGTKPIYANNAFTNDGNPSSSIMYLKTDALTSVPQGLDDYLTLSGTKVVAKDESSTNAMQTKIGIGFISSSSPQEVCPLTPLQVTTINSTPLTDLPNRPIVQSDGDACFLNTQSKDGKPMTKEEIQDAIITNTDPQVVSPNGVRELSFDDSPAPSEGSNTAGGDCSLQGEGAITANGACKCDSNYKRIWTPDGEKCEVCDPVKCNCGVKLNTNVPFIGRCILYGQTNDVGDPNFVGGKDGQGADQTIVVNQLNAFPVLISGLIKILMVLLGLLNFFNLIIGGVQMTIPESYNDGWGRVKGVAIGLAIFGALGVVLYLVNPNFFT